MQTRTSETARTTPAETRVLTYSEALNEALREEMRRDPRVFVMGEDVAVWGGGGVFGVTRGLVEEFGAERIRDTPISEEAIAALAVGSAMAGARPVAEFMYADFMALAMEPIVNQAAKIHYMFGGKGRVPVVFRAQEGAGRGNAAQHSQSLEAWFCHIPGLKVVTPSTPADAKGLLAASIRDDNPVVFLEHKLLYNTKGPVPAGAYTVPLGVADCKRPGRHVTYVGVHTMVLKGLEAADDAGPGRHRTGGPGPADARAARHRRDHRLGPEDGTADRGPRRVRALRDRRGDYHGGRDRRVRRPGLPAGAPVREERPDPLQRGAGDGGAAAGGRYRRRGARAHGLMATTVVLPKLGLTQDEGTIVRWLKTEGSVVTKGEPLFEVLTDKATVEVEASATGTLLRILVPEGSAAPVAAPIAVIGAPGEAVPSAGAAPAPAPIPSVPPAAAGAAVSARGDRVRISPRAKALADARGLDIGAIVGTGPGGRIMERDVQEALAAPRPGPPPRAAAPVPAPSSASSAMRAIIARRMMESLQTSAQLTLTTEVDMRDCARLREELGAELERREGVRLTYTDLIVRAAALALREHPAINARWEAAGVRRLAEIHVGVAVALDEGIVVPVVRDADRATVPQLSAAIRDLSERARTMRLRPDEMQGSTFTVTNLGMFEIDGFTPILNPPDAAILGVGRIRRRPVAVDERVEIRPTMVLSLTFDHRVVDGAPAAQFLQRVKHCSSTPTCCCCRSRRADTAAGPSAAVIRSPTRGGQEVDRCHRRSCSTS